MLTPDRTAIIFDWDDTLLFTEVLRSCHADPHCNWDLVRNYLCRLETQVIDLLRKAKEEGQVFIVTAAEEGWVEQSAGYYIPGVLPELVKVPVISACTRYRHLSGSVAEWKRLAMADILADHPDLSNRISIGDGDGERQAILHFTATGYVKSFKLIQRPHPEQLLGELNYVSRELASWRAAPADMDYQIAPRLEPLPSLTLKTELVDPITPSKWKTIPSLSNLDLDQEIAALMETTLPASEKEDPEDTEMMQRMAQEAVHILAEITASA